MRQAATLLLLVFSAGWASAQSGFAPLVSGILEPARKVEIRTSVNGRIETLPHAEGEDVQTGAVLVTVDARVQRARVGFARVAAEGGGAVSRAKTALEQAEALHKRVTSASAKGAAHSWEVIETEQGIELARADLAIAAENLAQARQQLELEEATLEEFSIRAPFPATVLQIFSELGETIDTQTVIMEIGNLDRLIATVFVPAEWAPDLSQGDMVDVALEANPSEMLPMRVQVVDPRVDPASRTVRVVLELENRNREILVGSSVTLQQP